MVGLVLVSHSRALAEGLAGLVRQMAPEGVRVSIAAGVGEARSEFGTDAVEISEAIAAVDSADGVLVLVDLGSAVLSAQLAVDLMPVELAGRVRICAAPLVEGAIAAAVQSGLGSDLDGVCREASGALAAKREQLEDHPPGEASQPEAAPAAQAAPDEVLAGSPAARSVVVTLTNTHGLHARPAARFVQTAAGFDADVRVANLTLGKGPVSARSLNAVATLGAIENHQICIEAAGPQAAEALQALAQLAADNFGEAAASTQPAATAPRTATVERLAEASLDADGALSVTAVSDGVAVGPLHRYHPPPPPISERTAEDPDDEWAQLEAARSAVRRAMAMHRSRLTGALGPDEAAIFDAHLLILDDPETLAAVRERIYRERMNAAAAWNAALEDAAAAFSALDDPYLQQRAADVLDVRGQVLFALVGKTAEAPAAFDHPVILFADDLTPGETAGLDMGSVLGLITAAGGPTSHSAILARALGIPAVAGAGSGLSRVADGATVALDGFAGRVWPDPSAALAERLAVRRAAWLAERDRLQQLARTPATTRDGRRVEVFANIGSVDDARLAIENGAEGVGLLRTEFLFLTRRTPPSEEEQLDAYRRIGWEMQGRPVTARTLDIGGDKEAPFVRLPPEANPFLGVRAIRLAQHDPGLFLPQLRALLRAAAEFPYRIMYPMVATLEDVQFARASLEQAHAELSAAGLAHNWPVEAGIMVEVPSAALTARRLAHEVDFFSVGTNDLTQYTLAAERGNPLLAGLSDALHPSVLRLIGETAAAAHAAGKWIGVCGELAGDPAAAAALVGLGVDELSLNPAGIPRIKAVLRSFDLPAAQALAAGLQNADGAPQARRASQAFLDGLS